MDIIAKTNNGFIINASSDEVYAILEAVNGKIDREKIGMATKIPALDYSTTIRKAKALKENYAFKELVKQVANFNSEFNILAEAIGQVQNSDI